jgi:hypothetical protein
LSFCWRGAEQSSQICQATNNITLHNTTTSITDIMMKNTIYLVLLSLALATNASAERRSLRLCGANKNSNDRNNMKKPSFDTKPFHGTRICECCYSRSDTI